MGRMTTVNVDVDVYIDDVIDEMDDQDLVDELQNRGYYVEKGGGDPNVLDKNDWRRLEEILTELPYHWENDILRRKVIEVRMNT
jgi:hypothetical protein